MVGGYKSDMIYGLEDYDFWLSIIELGHEVLRLPDVHFFYRQHSESMTTRMTPEQRYYSYQKIVQRHKDYYSKYILDFILKIHTQNNMIAMYQK